MAMVTASFTGWSITTPSLSSNPSAEDPPSGNLATTARTSWAAALRMAALVGVIGNEDVAGLYCSLAAIDLEDTAHEVAIDRRMEKHRRRHDQAPLAVQNHAAEIPGFADDR